MRLALLSIAAALCPTLATAQPIQGTTDRATEPVDDAARASHQRSIVAMPIPLSDPAIGTGLAVAGLALYHEDETGKPWTTGVGALYTDNGSWGAAAFHKAHFADDRYRLTLVAGYGDFNIDFYGIGPEAGDRGFSIGLNEKGAGGTAEFLVRVRPHLYLGPRYRGAVVKSSLDETEFPFPDLDLPEIGFQNEISSLGLSGEFDTRDSEFAPRRGIYSTAEWLAADEAFGSDYNYGRAALAVNGYHGLGEKTVLAWRGSACWTGDGAPFYDLCTYGSSNDLRGYPMGQYRDHAMFAVQTELRQHLFWRFGGVAFAGVGEVASDFGDFSADHLLPAAGFGVRFEASKSYGVNLSIDYAFGKDTEGLYFYVGEAF